jgi:hypothetical protein
MTGGHRRTRSLRRYAPRLAGLVALALGACAHLERGALREPALHSLDRSLQWLAAHPPDASRAPIGERILDAWTWELFARLHPDPRVRALAAAETRARLSSLEPGVEPTVVALSYWALALRNMVDQDVDATPHRAALARVDLEEVLAGAMPTTRLWTRELLRHAGVPGESSVAGTYLATRAAKGIERFEPTVRGAYSLYHEIAPVTDLGRAPPRGFSDDEVEFARRILPDLYAVSRRAEDVDAVAEVLVAAALLGARERDYYRDGIEWLLARQAQDGTYRRPREAGPAGPARHYRHAVLVASWALLETLR